MFKETAHDRDFIQNEKAPTPRSKVELLVFHRDQFPGKGTCARPICATDLTYLQSIDLMHWKYPELEETNVGWFQQFDPTYRTKNRESVRSGAAGYSFDAGNQKNSQPIKPPAIIPFNCYLIILPCHCGLVFFKGDLG